MTIFHSIDPTSGQTIAAWPAATPEQRDTALDAAVECAERWARTPLGDRAALLQRVARLLEQEEAGIAGLMTREMGKTWAQARAELRKCAWTARHFADHAASLLAEEAVRTEARQSGITYEPLGVIFAIMPWNFPFWQVFRFGMPALMAGNTVVFKHAPQTLGCGERIAELFRQAGAPRGLLQHLVLTTEDAAQVIADPRIAAVTLTGSPRAGRAVAAAAGAALKPVVLELGGSDPFIVMPSADLDAAVATAVQSRVGNNGQSCIAAKRIIAHASIADAFEQRVVAAMQALRLGDPMDESVAVGPLVSQAARDNLHAQVRATCDAGARLLTGGQVPPGPGFFYPPTVLADVPRESPAAREELFGPVMPIFRVDDFDAAIALANDTVYGLTATLFTRDAGEISAARERIRCGGLFVNAMSRSDPRLPFGGIGESGFGRELGRAGILSFCNVRTFWID